MSALERYFEKMKRESVEDIVRYVSDFLKPLNELSPYSPMYNVIMRNRTGGAGAARGVFH
ncbi:MAG: hypothetical protein V1837_08005 [Candidatus Woesearchaeota archaeon]